MAAKAVALAERASQSSGPTPRVADNAKSLADGFMGRASWSRTAPTTTSCCSTCPASPHRPSGRVRPSGRAGVVTNRNSVPQDPNGAWYTSGIRAAGTPALTTRGFGHDEFDRVAELIVHVPRTPSPAPPRRAGRPGVVPPRRGRGRQGPRRPARDARQAPAFRTPASTVPGRRARGGRVQQVELNLVTAARRGDRSQLGQRYCRLEQVSEQDGGQPGEHEQQHRVPRRTTSWSCLPQAGGVGRRRRPRSVPSAETAAGRSMVSLDSSWVRSKPTGGGVNCLKSMSVNPGSSVVTSRFPDRRRPCAGGERPDLGGQLRQPVERSERWRPRRVRSKALSAPGAPQCRGPQDRFELHRHQVAAGSRHSSRNPPTSATSPRRPGCCFEAPQGEVRRACRQSRDQVTADRRHHLEPERVDSSSTSCTPYARGMRAPEGSRSRRSEQTRARCATGIGRCRLGAPRGPGRDRRA